VQNNHISRFLRQNQKKGDISRRVVVYILLASLKLFIQAFFLEIFIPLLLQVGDGGIIVLDATLDASTTDDAEWELSGGPPSPCDVSFFNDNVLINGRSNLSKTPRNHKVSELLPRLSELRLHRFRGLHRNSVIFQIARVCLSLYDFLLWNRIGLYDEETGRAAVFLKPGNRNEVPEGGD